MQSATRRSLGGLSVIYRAGAGSGSATRTAVLEGAVPCIIRREYHDNIVEHYENPRNVGSLDKKDKFVGTVRKGLTVLYVMDFAIGGGCSTWLIHFDALLRRTGSIEGMSISFEYKTLST